MSENGEMYTAGKIFYTAAGSDGRNKSHLCGDVSFHVRCDADTLYHIKIWSLKRTLIVDNKQCL